MRNVPVHGAAVPVPFAFPANPVPSKFPLRERVPPPPVPRRAILPFPLRKDWVPAIANAVPPASRVPVTSPPDPRSTAIVPPIASPTFGVRTTGNSPSKATGASGTAMEKATGPASRAAVGVPMPARATARRRARG
jgi:hypothetical protein